jgi:hypothetical protein
MIGFRAVYKSYKGDRAYHRARITVAFISSLLGACFISDLDASVFPAMSLCISVLAGFTFTALFSDHAMMAGGLPPPKSENDRYDIRRMKALGENFKVRTKFFINISVVDILLVLLASVSVSGTWLCSHEAVVNLCNYSNNLFAIFPKTLKIVNILYLVVQVFIRCLAFILFAEVLYTFYRLAETIIAVMDIRRRYVEARLSGG